MAAGVGRRSLRFDSWDETLADVEALRAGGYQRLGKWNLAGCCDHLAQWTAFPVDGFPVKPLPWVVRATLGRFYKSMALSPAARPMPAGVPTLPQTVPAADVEEAAAVERFRAAVEKFRGHAGEYHPSPLLGRLSRAEWERAALNHAAHHLGFLVPRPATP